ncbi:serine/threonine-protein kinase [Sorangium sp. So ce216]
MNSGHLVTPKLRLVRPLGRGGMGTVWVADHLSLGAQVAVKFMAPELASCPGFVERFRREAMAAAQIKSPHVAQVFDHGVTEAGVPYILMELLEGEDLRRRISRLGPLSLRELASVVRQVSRALGRAHQLGIVHRDIKPDNIFLADAEGETFVKVLDFGVAKQPVSSDQAMTSTGSSFGTPLYMSPEQLLSAKHVDFRADLWALGIVGYYAMTGQVPFTGETLGALSVSVNAGVFTLPSAVRPGVPHGLDAWVTRALQRDPAARFGSVREMSSALDEALFGLAHAPTLPSGALDTRPGPPSAPGGPRSAALGPGGAGPPHSRGQARTFNGLVIPGAGAGRRSAGVLLAGAALAGAAALGLGISWVHRDPSTPGSPAADSSAAANSSALRAARAAPDGEEPTETPPAPPAEGARTAALAPASTAASSTRPPPLPAVSPPLSPALPAPARARRATPSVRPQPSPGPAARTNARARADRIGF